MVIKPDLGFHQARLEGSAVGAARVAIQEDVGAPEQRSWSSIDSLALQPFDYVEDRNGWIYLVKAIMASSGDMIAKAMYCPVAGKLKKCKNSLPDELPPPPHTPADVGGYLDVILDTSSVAKWYPRTSTRVTGSSEQCTDVIREISQALDGLGAKCYLFGSRLLDIHTPLSDWDVLVLTRERPERLLRHMLLVLSGSLRPFSHVECLERARRYSSQPHGIEYGVLAQLFLRSTPYLKSPAGEIGIFFSAPVCPPLLLDPRELDGAQTASLSARPVDSEGTSYHLPRRILVRDQKGRCHKIFSVLWELGGVERATRHVLQFSGLRKIGDREWWMGGRKAALCVES